MNERFLKACRREPVDRTPVWFMRQAGRYMAEYREIRKKHSMLEICREPELIVEVTLQPINRFDVDAAIIFSDLLIPLIPMGIALNYREGEGPRIENPVTSAEDVDRLRRFEPRDELDYVLDSIRFTRKELEGRVPLIGFAGAPFTLASYLIEGGSSRSFVKTKTFMYSEPKGWHRLASKLAESIRDYLLAQVEAGAHAVQVFDSWVGVLSPEDYREFVLPHSRKVLEGVRSAGAPVIHFGTGASGLLNLLKEAGGDVIGLDWRVDLDQGWSVLGGDVAVQGNLDPHLLFGPLDIVLRRTDDILARAASRNGHIFNLGHGILPKTPVETVAAIVEHVHQATAR
jgi:uroporphyrinogen decarboxylase